MQLRKYDHTTDTWRERHLIHILQKFELSALTDVYIFSFNNIKSINFCQNINDEYNVNKRGFGEMPPQTRCLHMCC